MGKREKFSILIPVLEFGRQGGYRVLSKLANEWIDRGCRVGFVAPCSSDAPYFPTKAEIYWVDNRGRMTDHRPGPENARFLLAKAGRLFLKLRSLLLGIRDIPGGWDIVLANQWLTAWPVALAPTVSAKVYYIQAYEPEYYESRRGMRNFLLKWFSLLTYFLPLNRIANSPVYLRYRACRARIWIPPGLDLQVFHPASHHDGKTGEPAAGLTVGCIGRAEPEKGTMPAIEAYREFVRRVPGSHRFRVADFGVPRDWLEGLQGLDRVTPTNDNELAEYYRSIDVLLALCTQQHGAHHYPVLEAMASKVTVISTGYAPADCENSWIVGSSPIDAAKALEHVYADPATAKAKAERAEAAVRAYAWPDVADRFLAELAFLSAAMQGNR